MLSKSDTSWALRHEIFTVERYGFHGETGEQLGELTTDEMDCVLVALGKRLGI